MSVVSGVSVVMSMCVSGVSVVMSVCVSGVSVVMSVCVSGGYTSELWCECCQAERACRGSEMRILHGVCKSSLCGWPRLCVCLNVCVCAWECECMCLCVHKRECQCTCACVSVCVCVCMCVSVCVCVCVCVGGGLQVCSHSARCFFTRSTCRNHWHQPSSRGGSHGYDRPVVTSAKGRGHSTQRGLRARPASTSIKGYSQLLHLSPVR